VTDGAQSDSVSHFDGAGEPKLSESARVDVSVVMPCLNEERSVGTCVANAWEGIRKANLRGEVIVADNGSTDKSVAIAAAAGARVVYEHRRGYGNAYLKGFSAARGRVIVMGDSDESYDFTALPELVSPLNEGFDYVLGSRFAGEIRRGAMPWSHRYIGNPALTATLNLLFRLRVTDAHSGLRAFTREALDKMALQCEGMEFASEIVVKAAQAKLRVTEIPITYRPRIGKSKLNSFEDGWRHLRFLFLMSPDYLFVIPGITLLVLGLISQVALIDVGGDSSVLIWKIFLALTVLAGSQLTMFGLFAKSIPRRVGIAEHGRVPNWVDRTFTLERGLICGAGVVIVGTALVLRQFFVGWSAVSDGGTASSAAILGLMCIALGVNLWFDAFFLAVLHLRGNRSMDDNAPQVAPAGGRQFDEYSGYSPLAVKAVLREDPSQEAGEYEIAQAAERRGTSRA
jgi:glycosyltransferase involved in cell wall biosynthesis